jgi:hypothetical protein
MNLADIVQRGWDAVGAGDFDALVADYMDIHHAGTNRCLRGETSIS